MRLGRPPKNVHALAAELFDVAGNLVEADKVSTKLYRIATDATGSCTCVPRRYFDRVWLKFVVNGATYCFLLSISEWNKLWRFRMALKRKNMPKTERCFKVLGEVKKLRGRDGYVKCPKDFNTYDSLIGYIS